jgi:hypothetical protein
MTDDNDLVKRLRSKTPNMVTGHAAMEEAATRIVELLAERDWYRERVVWGFYEDREPQYYQGKEGESEICEPVTAEEVTRLLQRWNDTEAKLEKALEMLKAAKVAPIILAELKGVNP